MNGRNVVRLQKRYDDERARVGKAAALIARARGDDAENLTGGGIEDRAAAEAFFDVHVFEFEVEAVLRPRGDRAGEEHARFLTDDPDQFVLLHVAGDRDEIALDHRVRARCEAGGAQSAAIDREQRKIARPGAFDVRRDIVQIAAEIDANARRAGNDVRRRQHQ